MNKTWFTSDWHFNHDKDFIWKERGFSSVEEMNRAIVERHNSVVAPEDDVFVLGDLCMSADIEANKKLIESLNGTIWFICGNHDSNKRLQMYKECKNVESKYDLYSVKLKRKGYTFLLSHYPTVTDNFDYNDKSLKKQVINLCGHTHTKNRWSDWLKYNSPVYHVDVDAHNCYPVLLDEIIKDCELAKSPF